MYRRNGTNGSWVLKASDGHGAYWTKAFALADDFEDADAKDVLTFYQAQDQAKKLARGDDDGAERLAERGEGVDEGVGGGVAGGGSVDVDGAGVGVDEPGGACAVGDEVDGEVGEVDGDGVDAAFDPGH